MRKGLAFFRFAAADAVLLDVGRDRPAGGVHILFYNAVGCGILKSITRELKERAIMFRCQKCKKWLKNITTETDVVYDGTIYHATNVPAKICPECGKITIYEIIQERIVQYATQRNVKNIDYAECENEEASASQLIL